MIGRQQMAAAHNDLSVPYEPSRGGVMFILAVKVALIAGMVFMD
jgi:hypothetical protein